MTKILIASNLLLWAAVIGLAVGYFALLRRPPTGEQHEHKLQDGTAGLVGSRPSLPADLERTLGSDRTGLILLAPPGCAPCDQLRDELARDGWHEETRLILITTSKVTGLTGTDSVAMTDEEAEDLSTQLGVRDHPYAWLIHEGRLRVGGVVNTPAHLKQLLDLASVGQAESTRHGEPE